MLSQEQVMQLLQTFIESSDAEAVKETLVQQGVPEEEIPSVLMTISNMAKGYV